MKISRILVYPIKSFRAYEPTSAELSQYGFTHDRRFMVLHHQADGSLKNMHVAHYPDLVLMFASIAHSLDPSDAKITMTYRPPKTSEKRETSLEIPLEPEVAELEEIQIEMHKSPTKAYNMGQRCNSWLSECLGYGVVLAYLGPNLRPVLMSGLSNPAPGSLSFQNNHSGGWLSSITSSLPTSISSLVGGGPIGEDRITFADCAPYLIVSDKSMESVSSRLPNGENMDITKFRPNIIVSGAEEAWEEDFWAEVTIGNESVDEGKRARMHCIHNCARCQSINIDYATGKPGTGESGKMLKLLQRDRRIDPGMKYSPVFGRYSFLDKASEGVLIAVGDEVKVTRRNTERTKFDWAGMATL